MIEHTKDIELPPFSEATETRIENAVFREIASERRPAGHVVRPGRVRRRRWLTGMSVAAAFAAGILVTPPLLGLVGDNMTMTTAESPGFTEVAPGVSPDFAVNPATDSAAGIAGAESMPGSVAGRDTADSSVGREIIQTAQVSMQVSDIAKAVKSLDGVAAEHQGFVESTNIEEFFGWVSVRVPSTELPAFLAAASETGEVTASSRSNQDVTALNVDLQAQVDTSRASVARLKELMAQTSTVSELIEAEVALTERQAILESYEQQLKMLQDQVAMSSVQIQLTPSATTTTADPAGFGDGLFAGWNGLIVSINALVIAAGFALPWLAIAAVGFLVWWWIRRIRRRSHRSVS